MTSPFTHPTVRISVLLGAIYGVVCQAVVRFNSLKQTWSVMTFSFVFILPLVLGFVTLWYASEQQIRSWWFRIFAPWATIILCLIVSLVIGWEGAICLIMAGVVYLPLASVGGIISGMILQKVRSKKIQSGILTAMLLLPLTGAYIESNFGLPVEYRGAHTSITIHASPETVWREIIRVPKITEPLSGFFYKMGFPKPIEATLSKEGIGGIRRASFEGGLVFTETVDQWIPKELLSFGIESAPDSIPTTTLDEHVVVGGRYFDVLRGTYRIERLSDSKVVLHLSSDFRVSTRFNFYAGIWATFLMRDIQSTILEVLKSRAERSGGTSFDT